MKNYVKKILPMHMGKIGFKFRKEFLKVYAYLIYTEDGSIYLFDTGLNPLFYSDKEKIMENLTHFIKIDVEEKHLLGNKLRKLGIEKENLKAVILSHLHFDHSGGISEFQETDVPVIVQKRECEIAKDLAKGRAFEYKAADIEGLDKKINLVMFEGDSLVDDNKAIKCLITHGHSAGHQSLLLEGRNKSMLLTGDAVYTREELDSGRMSAIPFRRGEALDSIERVQKLAKHCDYVICGHDRDVYIGHAITL